MRGKEKKKESSMNDGEKPSRRSSGMYFLKVGNQVASEGEEKKKAKLNASA